jgi:hypothetical protein
MTSNFDGDISDQTKEVKWSVSAVSIALTLSSLSLLATIFLKDKFCNSMETGMVRRWWPRVVFGTIATHTLRAPILSSLC